MGLWGSREWIAKVRNRELRISQCAEAGGWRTRMLPREQHTTTIVRASGGV